MEEAQIIVLQPQQPEPVEAAQEYVIAINWNDFHDVLLPMQEGTITGVGIEWEQCTMAHQYIYG